MLVNILIRIILNDNPARKIISIPDIKIMMEVPRSGCLNIKIQGISTAKNAYKCILGAILFWKIIFHQQEPWEVF